jgi:hypothetical protein
MVYLCLDETELPAHDPNRLAATGALTKSAQRSRLLEKRHRGLPKIAAPQGSVGQREPVVDGQRAGAARLNR